MPSNLEIPQPVEQEPAYDWRKGRKIETWEHQQSGKKITHSSGLEMSEQEKKQWQQLINDSLDEIKRLNQNSVSNAQIIGYLNNPILGPLIGIFAKKWVEITKIENNYPIHLNLNLDFKLLGYTSVEDMNADSKRNINLMQYFSQKILSGETIDDQNFQVQKITGYSKTSKDKLASDAWHLLVQGPIGRSGPDGYIPFYLPYLLALSKDDAERAISSLLEEINRSGSLRKFESKLIQEAQANQ